MNLTGKTTNGVLSIDREKIQDFARKHPDEDVYVQFHILSNLDKSRKTYFFYVGKFSEYTGYSTQESHMILKTNVLDKMKLDDGTKLYSTKELTTPILWKQYTMLCIDYIFKEFDIML